MPNKFELQCYPSVAVSCPAVFCRSVVTVSFYSAVWFDHTIRCANRAAAGARLSEAVSCAHLQGGF